MSRGSAIAAVPRGRIVTASLRRGVPEDAERAGAICYAAFKAIAESHGFPPDFSSAASASELMAALLADRNVYSVVAESGGCVVGSNFLAEAGTIAGVGPITVDPAVQDGQIGRRLMEEVVERARVVGVAGMRLVQAAYHQRSLSLYTKLGFVAREPLSTLQGPPLAAQFGRCVARRAVADDVSPCNALCARVHGHDRGAELTAAVQRDDATVVERDGRITGYATAIGFFGHAVAETNDDLKALIGFARSFDGPGFLLPTRNGELLRWCLEHGLRIVQPMTLMSIGLYNEPAGAYLPSVLF
jgi:GNAT superfamily N-acetyltransferase